MTVEEIRAAYYTKPFRPFVVRFKDGRKFRVVERHSIGISPTGNSITIAPAKDVFEEISISQVATIEQPKSKRRKRSA